LVEVWGDSQTSLQKVVIPLKKGIHAFFNCLKRMDSRLRGNDNQVLPRLFAGASSQKKTSWKPEKMLKDGARRSEIRTVLRPDRKHYGRLSAECVSHRSHEYIQPRR
jgi:hypothetical protein